VTAGRIKKKL